MKRWFWAIPVIFVATFLAFGLARVRFNTEILDLFPRELPEIGTLKLYQKNFQGRDKVVISLKAPAAWANDPQGGEKLLAASRSLREHLLNAHPGDFRRVIAEPPWAGFNPQAAELLAYYWLNQSPEDFAKMIARTEAPRRDEVIAASIEKLSSLSPEDVGRGSYDPLGFLELPGQGPWASQQSQPDPFVARSGGMRVMFAYLADKRGFSSYWEGKKWLASFHASLNQWQSAHPEFQDVTLGATGNPVFVSEISGSMMKDLGGSLGMATVLIALLFLVVFRRISLLILLQVMLGLILLVTFSLGGWLFGDVNAISLGFGAILLGLAADYGLVLYTEISRFPELTVSEMRRKVASSVWSAAVTTSAIFGVLYMSSFRGVSQLGALVSLGILSGGVIMLYIFVPIWVTWQRRWFKRGHTPKEAIHTLGRFNLSRRAALNVTGALALGIVGVLGIMRFPGIDGGTKVLEPSNSAAFGALHDIQDQFGGGAESIYALFHAPTLETLLKQVHEAEPELAHARDTGLITGFNLPLGLLPNIEHQNANLAAAKALAARWPEIRTSLETAGYEGAALTLTEHLLSDFGKLADAGPAPVWPRNEISTWALEQIISQPEATGGEFVTLGSFQPVPGQSADELRAAMPGVELLFTSWKYMGPGILKIVKSDLTQHILIIGAVLLIMLWIVFRRFSEVLLSLGSLTFSMLILLAVMRVTGLQWNLMNLMAVPLMLGTGIDHSIHLQISLQRHDGSLNETFRSIGMALLLCGVTNMIGFASLLDSSSTGLVSLGLVSTMGVGISAIVSVFLLPAWWQLAHPQEVVAEETAIAEAES